MIVDFNYPNLVGTDWAIRVIRSTNKGSLNSKIMKFKTKEEAFAYYEHIRQMWRHQKVR